MTADDAVRLRDVWWVNRRTFVPEPAHVLNATADGVAVRLPFAGRTDVIHPTSLYPTEDIARFAAIQRATVARDWHRDQLAAALRFLGETADPPLAARIAGPDLSDLADLPASALELPTVDDEAVDLGATFRPPSDPTRADLRGLVLSNESGRDP